MYSGCDYLLFVYILILPSLLHSLILFNCFYNNFVLYLGYCNTYTSKLLKLEAFRLMQPIKDQRLTGIHTPFRAEEWAMLLQDHPEHDFAYQICET